MSAQSIQDGGEAKNWKQKEWLTGYKAKVRYPGGIYPHPHTLVKLHSQVEASFSKDPENSRSLRSGFTGRINRYQKTPNQNQPLHQGELRQSFKILGTKISSTSTESIKGYIHRKCQNSNRIPNNCRRLLILEFYTKPNCQTEKINTLQTKKYLRNFLPYTFSQLLKYVFYKLRD